MVGRHYSVPVVSYADAALTELYRQVSPFVRNPRCCRPKRTTERTASEDVSPCLPSCRAVQISYLDERHKTISPYTTLVPYPCDPREYSSRTPVAPRVLESCLTPAVPLGPRVLEHSSAARTPAEAQWYGRDPIRTGSRSAATPSACATRRTSRTSSPASSVSTYAGRYHPLTTTPATIVLREYRTVRPNQSTADGAIARQAVLVFAVLTVPLPRSGAE